MNRKVRGLALSALLMSAVAAGPVSANANNTGETGNSIRLVPAASVVAQPAAAFSEAFGFADPLELARTYAPETAEDWKKTLDTFHELTASSIASLSKSVKIELKSVAGVGAGLAAAASFNGKPIMIQMEDADGSGNPQVIRLERQPVSIELKRVKGEDSELADGGENKLVSVIEAVPALTISTGGNPGKLELNDGDHVHFAGAAELQPGVQADGNPVVHFSVSADNSREMPSLLKAQIELAKAVEADDADAIREKLADLLQEYKQTISKLQAAKAEKAEKAEKAADQ